MPTSRLSMRYLKSLSPLSFERKVAGIQNKLADKLNIPRRSKELKDKRITCDENNSSFMVEDGTMSENKAVQTTDEDRMPQTGTSEEKPENSLEQPSRPLPKSPTKTKLLSALKNRSSTQQKNKMLSIPKTTKTYPIVSIESQDATTVVASNLTKDMRKSEKDPNCQEKRLSSMAESEAVEYYDGDICPIANSKNKKNIDAYATMNKNDKNNTRKTNLDTDSFDKVFESIENTRSSLCEI